MSNSDQSQNLAINSEQNSKQTSGKHDQTQYTTKNKILAYSAFLGIIRGTLGFPIEQPLEAIKTQWQSKPYFKNEYQVMQGIIKDKGIMGLYAGSTPNFSRMIVKNLYRYPLMIYLPSQFKKILPLNFDEKKFFSKFLTGSTIAVLESFILCPFERFKTLFITQSGANNLNYAGYYKKFNNSMSAELLKGVTPLMGRQAVAWISFLEADLLVKQTLRKYYQIKDNENIPTRYLLPGSLVVAIINTICVMPLDAVKTFFQKVDPTASWVDAVREIHSQGGLKGFFVGWRLRYAMYLLHAIFTVDLLERLENWANQLSKQE
eukprot:403366706